MSNFREAAAEVHASIVGVPPSAMLLGGMTGLMAKGGLDRPAKAARRHAAIGLLPGSVRAKPTGWLAPRVARSLDILVSLVLLALLCPLMLALALAIRWDSAGPAIFRQQRLGLAGKPFTILKFRSMDVNAEAGGPVWASVADARVTRIGRLLRATRLDELPQLLNVLKGDMSLIGPRPERAHFTEQLAAEIPHFQARLLVKPGVTGWAQVNLPYGASVEDARAKLAYDLQYIQHRDLWMILRILARTVLVMLARAGR